MIFFFFQAEDGIRDVAVTGVQTCALPIFVVDVKIFSRKGLDKDERARSIESEDVLKLQRDHQDELRIIEEERNKKFRKLLLGKVVGRDLMDPESGDVILKKKGKLAAEILKKLSDGNARHIILGDPDAQ